MRATSQPLLILDANYLCHRAHHSRGGMDMGENATDVLFGVLFDVISLQHLFGTNRVAWVFDHGRSSFRRDIYPGYKASRRKKHVDQTAEERVTRHAMYAQINDLRRHHLAWLGFKNIFAAKGFEADDIIAQLAADLPDGDRAIIIAADQDLWQCLRSNVWCYNPQSKRSVTAKSFYAEWGIPPVLWASVKAWAGCQSDDIPGLPGIGEKSAAKWVAGTLPDHHKTFRIISNGLATHTRNIKLTQLPFPGTPKYTVRPDQVLARRWVAFCKRFDLGQLMDRPPLGTKRGVGRGE